MSTPSIADLEQAVEKAYQLWDFICDDMGSHEDARNAKERFVKATVEWLTARRAAHDSRPLDTGLYTAMRGESMSDTPDCSRMRCLAARAQVAALTAEYENLREQIEVAAGGWSKCQSERAALTAEIADLRLDLANLTRDAAAECGRLRAERNGLLKATEEYLRLSTMADYYERANRRDALCSAVAAVAACTPEEKP